ncbi:MAG: DNA-binding response regulator [Desulfuromonas sp.]|nr:MAG: DNA-binding response regulator [Desulfuromonas sp.]
MMKTILVIDDDDSLRRVVEFQLQQAGYQVETAVDGEEGIEKFRQLSPDLVLTDVQMPGLSGDEVLEAVQEEKPGTLVMVVTAFGTVEKAVEAMRSGATDYLTKPFSRDALLLAVERAFAFRDLERENRKLREQLSAKADFSGVVGRSTVMQRVFDTVSKVAASEATVLIGGESGTGKELIAQALHQGSDRKNGPFIPVNCAAIPRELIESELFGHLKGAFTGAVKDRTGKFAQAEGGTIFLDEVGELPLELQPKLLRALQEREIEPVGGKPCRVDVRVVAATNRDLDEAVREGLFREDLYYRLAVIPVELPPLRERREDIPLLVRHFLLKHGGDLHLDINEEAMRALADYRWPGNVRELENLVERMIVLRRGDEINVEDLPIQLSGGKRDKSSDVLNLPEEGYPLEQLEADAVRLALQRSDGNQTRAARFLSIPRHTLIYRMEKYDIKSHDS